MGWADAVRKLKVRANADTPADARTAIKFGAEGIGLCRTEHMFFEEDPHPRRARDDSRRRREGAPRALAKLLPMQRADFVELFKIMKGLPVTIRLLDPPLHEFLPHTEEEIAEVAQAMGADPKKLADRARDLHEFNPMLGFRGCRLAIAYPEIAEMQARAIFEAAVEAGRATGNAGGARDHGAADRASKAEFDLVKAHRRHGADGDGAETKSSIYQVGTMIELPRAALMAGEIAETAEFFSFGTNDLTQTAFGISRDDAASFLGHLHAKGILAADPFVSIDREGVGELVKIAAERGRKVRPQISSSASAASTAAIPPPSTTCPASAATSSYAATPGRARLRLVLALPRADRAAGRGAGRTARFHRCRAVTEGLQQRLDLAPK
jgi:pyruvate,orthophosphate dikinase